jgi:hypothetical protein
MEVKAVSLRTYVVGLGADADVVRSQHLNKIYRFRRHFAKRKAFSEGLQSAYEADVAQIVTLPVPPPRPS